MHVPQAHSADSTSGAIAMYAIGIVGIRYFKFATLQQGGLFKTVIFVLVGPSFNRYRHLV